MNVHIRERWVGVGGAVGKRAPKYHSTHVMGAAVNRSNQNCPFRYLHKTHTKTYIYTHTYTHTLAHIHSHSQTCVKKTRPYIRESERGGGGQGRKYTLTYSNEL